MAELAPLSVREARAALLDAGLGAELAGDPGAAFSSATLDSRAVPKGSLFAAFEGAKADGHDHAAAALAAGASVLLLSKQGYLARRAVLEAALAASGGALLAVDAVLPAFQALARAWRLRHPRLVRVGITGSSGKTTTKEIVASILSKEGRVAMNRGNLNSDQGLALSLFGIRGDEDYGVFEMGMNRRGEMDELALMYEPDHALVTRVGTAHIGILGSRQAIAEEKKRIFSRFDGAQVGYVDEEDDFRGFLKEGVPGEVVEYGMRGTAGLRGAADLGLDGWAIDWEGLQVRFPLVGRHGLENALAALTLAARLGIRAESAAAGLEAVRPLFGRSEILRGRVTVVSDCYNSNPESAAAALAFCDSLSWEGRRLYVLGSMLELGPLAEAEHRRLGGAAARSKASGLIFFGEEARSGFDEARAAGFRGFLHFETDIGRLGLAVGAWTREGDLVLLKGSRGMALERLLGSIPR